MLNEIITPARAAEAALAAYAGGPAVAVVALIEGPAPGRRLLLFETGATEGTLGDAGLDALADALARRALAGGAPAVEAQELSGRKITLYVEAHRPPEELLIVGAGHIAVPLARLGLLLGYRVTVLDDREEFASPARFPETAAVLRTDFADPFRGVAIGPRTHVVLVTRAHRYDFDCLRRLLEGDAAPRYIGMIGSRRRVRAAFHALLEAGLPREELARVRAPVGLDIGAETPEEIAISIAAELVLVHRAPAHPVPDAATRRGGDAARVGEGTGGSQRQPAPLSDSERVLQRLLPEGRPRG